MKTPKPVFYRTLGIFREITGRNLFLEFREDVATAYTDGKKIILPVKFYDDKHPRPVYTAFEHELAHIVFKSDVRVMQDFVRKHPECPNLARMVFNLLDDYRVESLWAMIYAGSEEYMKQLATLIMEETFKEDVSDIIKALFACRADRPDLIPKTLPKDLVEGIRACFERVKHGSILTVRLAAEELLRLIEEHLREQHGKAAALVVVSLNEAAGSMLDGMPAEEPQTLRKDELERVKQAIESIESGGLFPVDPQKIIEEERAKMEQWAEEIKQKVIEFRPVKPTDGIIGEVVTRDVFERDPEPSEPDHEAAAALRRFFRRLRWKAVMVEDEEGIDIDIDNYIQRTISKVPIPAFVREEAGPGLNIVILLDCSGSMISHDKIRRARKVLLTLYEALRGLPSIELEVYAFSGHAYNNYKTPVVRLPPWRMRDIWPNPNWNKTHTWRAVQYVTNILRMKSGRKLLIIITDGVPMLKARDKNQLMAAAGWTAAAVQRARRCGVRVYTILIPPGARSEEARWIFGPESTWCFIEPERLREVLTDVVCREILRTVFM